MRSPIASIVSTAFVSIFVSGALLSAAHASSIDDAKKAYAAREFDDAGIQKAQEAADIYADLLKSAADEAAQVPLLVGQSEALYFVGDASADTKVKIEKHDLGLKAADKASKILGVKDVTSVPAADIAKLKALPEDQRQLLAHALYNRGINLGKWGQANGVMTSVKRWPELRANMELLEKLGLESTHDYGSFRTLGKVYGILPTIVGGNTKKALEYLGKAVAKTTAPNTAYSTNGYNNTFYAELLDQDGKTDQARTLLEGFLSADPTTLNPDLVPENKRAQADAKELLKKM